MNSPLLHAVSLGLVLIGASARADLVIPGADGSDGALNITQNTVIDLSQATTAAWDDSNAANAGKGVYDSNKWAVVFKYTDVTIATNATVTFKNHASRAPVVWLVSGDVRIGGTVNVSGQNSATTPDLAEPGPGGFRGGMGVYSGGVLAGPGLGMGGGGLFDVRNGYSGGYGSASKSDGRDWAGKEHGNPSLVPLLGGSGGAGSAPNGGGGGGGAMLIACTRTFALDGMVLADGGIGSYAGGYFSGSGSGGGLRVVAETLLGTGRLSAVGGSIPGLALSIGGVGRIRLERVINHNSIKVVPDPSVVDLSTGSTVLLWPPASAPSVKIISIGGVAVPEDPRAAFGTFGADVALPRASVTLVLVETTNVEQASQVKIRGTPRSNASTSDTNLREVLGVVDAIVSENPLVIRWKAELPVQDGYAAVQVKVVRP